MKKISQFFFAMLLFFLIESCFVTALNAKVGDSFISANSIALPSTLLKKNTQPDYLLGQKIDSTKKEHLDVVSEVQKIEHLSLDLASAIALALKHNSALRTTYISRISQRYQYYLDKRNRRLWHYADNNPVISVGGSRNLTQLTEGKNKTTNSTNTWLGGPKLGFTSPIGTQVSIDGTTSNDNKRTFSANISVTQPLLKGFGYAINAIPWKQTELAEKVNTLSLRSQVSATILQVIQQYRGLIEASLTHKNNIEAWKQAKQTLENNKIEVKAGRLPETDLLSSQIQLESTQNDLLDSEDSIKQQQHSFASLLGLDKAIDFDPDNTLIMPAVILNEKELIDYALANKPDYLQSQLNYQSILLDLKREKNNQLWDLSLTASAGKRKTPSIRQKETDYSAGLALTIPLDTTQQKKALIDAKIAAENGKINLRQKKLEIISDIHKQVSALKQSFKRLEIQKKQVDLQIQQVENTQLSLKYGRTSAYDLAQQQQQLNASKNALVASKINYLNQLSSLDDYLGTALNTWQVVLSP